MFFEARTHELVEVKDIHEACKTLEKVKSYQVVFWKDGGRIFGMVDDTHIDDTGIEAAVLDMTYREETGCVRQIESISYSNMTPSDRVKSILYVIEEIGPQKPGKTPLPLAGEENRDTRMKLAWFTCGCCGSGFQSFPEIQKRFGQDAGYGMCDGCVDDFGM